MATSERTADSGTGQRTVQHTKKDALDEREFEQLLAACHGLEDYWSMECRFVILVAGRLGLRAGEIAHMERDWIDWRRQMIEVPRHQSCTNGRDGGMCGYCRGKAEQMADVRGPDAQPEDFYHTRWSPKTDAAAREIPFDADTRAMLAIETYFDRFAEFNAGRNGVNRRVKRAARACDAVEEAATYPHALRATAANRFAARGLDVFALKAVMGWSCLSTAKCYIADSGERTAAAIRDTMI